METSKQKGEKAHVLRHSEEKQDGDESARKERVRTVPMPQDMEQNQMNRDEPCSEQGELPAPREEWVVLGHGFGPLAEIAFPSIGACAKT